MRASFQERSGRLALLLCLVAAIVGGIWLTLEGVDLIGPLLFGRRLRTDLSDGLPALYLELSPETYQALYRQWHASLRTGIPSLEEADWMQGQIRLDGRTYPVLVWLQEESFEHWQDTKWSLQVKLRDPPDARSPASLLEMRSFVARSPATHRSLDEWLYSEVLRSTGILAPRHQFAHLWMNGDDWGVYALQETPSETFLTSQGRSPGVILRVDDSLFGRQQAQLADGVLDRGQQAEEGGWPGLVRAEGEVAAQIERDPTLQEEYAAAVGLLKGFQSGQLAPSQVFDAEQMGRYLAYTQWWGIQYGTRFEGERYAFHALTSRLEPIGGSALPLEAAYAHVPGLAQYGDLEVMEAYLREVERIAQPETIEALQAAYQDSLRHYQAALAREFPASVWTAPWPMLAERQAILVRSLSPQETVQAYSLSQEPASAVRIHVANLTTYPVILDEIEVGERAVGIERAWVVDDQGVLLDADNASAVVLAPRHEAVPRHLALNLPESVQRELWPHDTLWNEPIQLATRVAGRAEAVAVEVRRDLPLRAAAALPARPTVEQALAQHPFLDTSKSAGVLEVKPGDWDVAGDLVLPAGYGLLAFGPTRLRFGPGAILFPDGPLLLHGAEDSEIYLVPRERDWAGVVVLEADDDLPSSLSYVTVGGTSGLQRDGWHVPGGLTFYQSPVTLSHCRLLDTTAPAALYVAATDFECEGCEFGRISAQALRAQYAEGRLTSSRFYDVLGNAVAARGSRIEIRDLSMVRVYDPGIVAQQDSVVTVRDGYAENVSVVVASSDGSHVQVQDTLIRQVGTAGLAAYAGEPGGRPASVHTSGVTFEDEYAVQALVQPGSSVRLEGLAAGTKTFDTDRLSWRQGITNTIRPLGYMLGPSIWLVGYDLANRELKSGEPLQVTLYWHTTTLLDRDYTVFVHIRDATNEMVTGYDSMPRQNSYPTTAWQAGETVDDLQVVPLDLAPGEYQIVLGLYHLAGGQRLPVYGLDGEPIADASILLDSFYVTER